MLVVSLQQPQTPLRVRVACGRGILWDGDAAAAAAAAIAVKAAARPGCVSGLLNFDAVWTLSLFLPLSPSMGDTTRCGVGVI